MPKSPTNRIASLAKQIKTANAKKQTAKVDSLADEIIRIATSARSPKGALRFIKTIPPGTV